MSEITESTTRAADALRASVNKVTAIRKFILSMNDPDTMDLESGDGMILAMIDCPKNEPMHYHHDGCPACETS